MDLTNKEVQDFLRSLHIYKVRYMLVGGVATVFHGHVRTTQDLDLWVQDTPENRKKLTQVLEELKVPGASNYEHVELIPGRSTIKIGDKGFVADFMGYTQAFSKTDFDACYERAQKGDFNDIPITVINKSDLIKEKEKLGRPKDIDDVQNLKKH